MDPDDLRDVKFQMDPDLWNAKLNVEFCVRQMLELAPDAVTLKSLSDKSAFDDQFYTRVKAMELNQKWKNVVTDLAKAQAEYIRLLETRLNIPEKPFR